MTHDEISNPAHYDLFPDGMQAIDVIRAALTPEEFAGYCKGNFLKYRLRAGEKGDPAKCLGKAEWYRAELREHHAEMRKADIDRLAHAVLGNAGGAAPQSWPDETRRQDAAAEDEAFARIEASQPRIDSGPMWSDWSGADKAPCNPDMAVEVRFRNGQVVTAQARELIWDQDGSACDIVAWRDPWQESAEKSGIPNFRPRRAVGADVAFPSERGLYFAATPGELEDGA